jgi:hypothetical protein
MNVYFKMTPQVCIKLDDTTSASDLDSFFTQLWSKDKRVRVVLDATECKKISLGRVLSMKSVLDEHRYSSRKYIDHTVVVVNSRFARFILRTGLAIIRTERPVFIQAPKSCSKS